MLRRIVADNYGFGPHQVMIGALAFEATVSTISFVSEEYSSILAV
jgi:hypothetical protein